MKNAESRDLTMFRAVFTVVLLTLFILVSAFLLWGSIFGLVELTNTPPWLLLDRQSESLSTVTTAALATAGGLGTAVVMTVNFRKQLLEERNELRAIETMKIEEEIRDEEAIARYAEMLASSSTPKVAAGLLGLSALADKHAQRFSEEQDNVDAFNQSVVNVICAFLRSSCNDETTSSEREKVSTEVNQSQAVGIIAEHVRVPIRDNESAEVDVSRMNSWSNCHFDLQETIFLCPVRIERCVFNNQVLLWGARFIRSVYAEGVEFAKANFNGVEFCGERVLFERAKFGYVSFEGNCRFHKDAVFAGSEFERTTYFGSDDKAKNGKVSYPGSTIFEASVDFSNVYVHEEIIFYNSQFNGERRTDGACEEKLKFINPPEE